MKLMIDDKEIGTVKTPGLFKKSWKCLCGSDSKTKLENEKIANYPDSFFLSRGTTFGIKTGNTGKQCRPKTAAGTIDKVIVLKVLKDVMKYDKATPDSQSRNNYTDRTAKPGFHATQSGSYQTQYISKVGAVADELVRDPNGAKMHYVPKMPEVIAATPMINPGGKYTLTVKLPNVPGDYPYICTSRVIGVL